MSGCNGHALNISKFGQVIIYLILDIELKFHTDTPILSLFNIPSVFLRNACIHHITSIFNQKHHYDIPFSSVTSIEYHGGIYFCDFKKSYSQVSAINQLYISGLRGDGGKLWWEQWPLLSSELY